MKLARKIRLSGKYGRMYYIVAGIIDAACAVYMLFWPMSTPIILLIKLLSIPVLAYLLLTIATREKAYFYLNLGFSRNEYRFIPVAVDALVFVLLTILALSLSHVLIPA